MSGPLKGVRIIEFAGIGPGPFCGMMLADHGAEVIRIDRPGGFMDGYTALPIQIYSWTARPQEAFRDLAAAGSLVLLIVLLTLNLTAIILRQRLSKSPR